MILFIILAGAAAVYLLQNLIYEKFWSNNLKVSIDFSKNKAVKGETVNLVEVITNNKVLPLLMLQLKFIVSRNLEFTDIDEDFSVSDQCYKNDVFSLLFFQKITRTLSFKCAKRGFYTITEADEVSSNLFLDTQYVKHISLYTELTVFPAPADSDRLDIPFKKIMGELLTRRYLYEDPFEFRGIRDYTTGDTYGSINWKASAKTGDFKVNMHDYTSSQEICILLNLEAKTNWESDLMPEECISVAAGLCAKLLANRIGVRIISNGCDICSKQMVSVDSAVSPEHMDTVLNSLARIDLKLAKQNFVEIARDEALKADQNTLYVLISVVKTDALQKAMEELAIRTNGAMWILPYTYTEDFDLNGCPSVSVFPWKVTVNEK
jgi:uncharacterized protein (DUF58 family)